MLRQRSPLRLLMAAALVAAGACGDQRTPTVPLAPDGPSAIQSGGGGTRVKLKSLQLSANTLRIDGPGVTAAVVIGNPGQAYAGSIYVRGEIVQPGATRRAFQVPTQCVPGDIAGFLPNGECSMSIPATASNSGSGNGTLAPGAADFVARVLIINDDASEIELATKTTTVNLVATPSISALTLASTTLAIGGPAVNYIAMLQNPAKSLQSVALQGWIVQGTTRRAAGGTQVTCGSNVGVLPPGTCTINSLASASATGTGTLTPGPATFELNLFQVVNGVQTTFDTKTVAITLVSGLPFISSLALDATSIVLGSGVDYTVELQNYGAPKTDILLQGEMVQGSVVKGAGGFTVDCGSGLGILPTTGGTSCSLRLTAAASSDATGGAFVPGSANFVLHLYKAPPNVDPIEYDTKTVAVTLLSNNPTITALTPTSSYVVLGSGSTNIAVTVQNPGNDRTGIILQGWIRQGTARRAAGGTLIECSAGAFGPLPQGTCNTTSVIVAGNDPAAGTGTLVFGPATFDLQLIDGSTILDTRSIPITLVPTTPSIVQLDLESTTIQIGGSTRYHATVFNPGSSTLSSVLVQGTISQGSVENAAGGVVTTCPTNGALAPGSCAVTFTVNALNNAGPTSILAPGAAQYNLKLFIGGSVVDTRSVPITLTSP